MDPKILSLPWQIQLALGAGYAAYAIAYTGVRSHHSAVDTAFRALLFSIVTTVSLSILGGLPVLLGVPMAFIITIAAGIWWRMKLRDGLKRILHKYDVSWANDTPTAWRTITAENTRHFVCQVAVELDDGTWLICSDLRTFADAPIGACTFGLEGDVALYVDTEIDADGVETINSGIRSESHGDRMTYVPASRVRRISIRYKPIRDVPAEEPQVVAAEALPAAAAPLDGSNSV